MTLFVVGKRKKVGRQGKSFFGVMTDMTPDPIKSPVFPTSLC